MPQPRPHKITDAYTVYKLDAQARRVTKDTLRTYKDRLEPFINWCASQGIYILTDITPALLRSYLIHLFDRQLASATVNGVARVIKAWLNFCVLEGLIPESPMRKVAIPKIDKKIPPAFSVEDAQKLITACTSERDEAVVLFLLDSGVRASEFINLNGGDVDLTAGNITVRQGKGRKDRTTYFGIKARKALSRYYIQRGTPETNDPIWTSEKSRERLTTSGLRQMLERIGKAAGVAHCSPHTFRRTFALWSLRAGMDIYRLQRLMGHEDLTVLRQYLDLVQADLKQAHQEHGAVDTMLK